MTTIARLENVTTGRTVDLLADLQVNAALVWAAGRPGQQETLALDLTIPPTVSDRRAAVLELEGMLALVRDWAGDALSNDEIWLVWSTDNEPLKRVFLGEFSLQYGGNPAQGVLLQGHGLRVALGLTHHPFLESVSPYNRNASASAHGGRIILGNDVGTGAGTADGRIEKFTATTTAGFAQLWMGIRPGLYGSFTGFNPLIEAEVGTMITGDAGSVADANASAGNAVEIDFSVSEDLTPRFYIPLSAFTTDWSFYRGRFLVLARYNVDNTTDDIAVRLSTSLGDYATSQIASQQQTQYLPARTDYSYVELGSVQIPPQTYRRAISANLGGAFADYSFIIEAGRYGGAGSLRIDDLVLIPRNHMCYLESPSAAPGTVIHLYTHPDDTYEAYNLDGGVVDRLVPAPERWLYPRTGGTLVFVGQRPGEHVLTDTLNVEMTMYKRWLSYHQG